MSDHERLRAYTHMALLNAIGLSLISIQMVAWPAFVLLIWIVPAIFAIQASMIPPRLTLLSCMMLVSMAFLLFGLDVGAVTVVYVLTGAVAGVLRRWRYPSMFRIPLIAFMLAVLIVCLAIFFLWLLGLTINSLLFSLSSALSFVVGLTPLMLVLGLGLAGVALITAHMIDNLVSHILVRLPEAIIQVGSWR